MYAEHFTRQIIEIRTKYKIFSCSNAARIIQGCVITGPRGESPVWGWGDCTFYAPILQATATQSLLQPHSAEDSR